MIERILSLFTGTHKTSLQREIAKVEAAQERDRARAAELVGPNPTCCLDCALRSVDSDLLDKINRRTAWLDQLRRKQDSREGRT